MRRFRWWLCAALLVALASTGLRAQTVIESTPLATWGVNGDARALTRVGRTLYVGGTFDIVGPPTGGLAVASAADPNLITPSTGVDTVSRLASDGAGGWYVAEYPHQVDGGYFVVVRHVRPNGTNDPAFVPALFESGSSIYSLVVAGGRVYVAGAFNRVNGVNHSSPVALDGATGALLPWTLTTRSGGATFNVLFAAGAGSRVYFPLQGTPPDLLAVDGATGTVLPFQAERPPFVVSVDQTAATSTRLFAVGDACGNGGVGLCAFDAPTGMRVWTWSLPAPAYVAGVWTGGSRVYAFTRNPETLYALDATTGAVASWRLDDIGVVFDVAEAEGRVYVVTSRGLGVLRAYAFDASTAAPVNWNPLVEGVYEVEVDAGRVAMGGGFRTAGGLRRRHLVALDLDSGRPAPVQPAEPFGAVNALAAYGDIVFVGMESAAPEVYAFSSATGQKYAWGLVPNGKPLSLLVAGQTLYVGGFFSELSGEPRGFLGAVDLTTGALSSWNPALPFQVSELSATSTRLYAAGLTGGPYGSTIGHAAFDLATRQRLQFDAGLVYVPGTKYFATTRDRLLMTSRFYYPPREFGVAWLDPDTGAIRSEVRLPFWTQIAVGSGDRVIVGGFDEATNLPSLGALDARTGAPTTWAPRILASLAGGPLGGWITALLVQPDLVAVGGAMANVEGRQVSQLAVFPATAAAPPSPRAVTASLRGATATLSWLPGGPTDAFLVEAGSSSGAANVGVFPVGPATSVSGTLGTGRYFVRVKGVGDGGVGPASSEVILDVPSTSAAPQAPGGLSGTVTAGVVTLTWTAAAGNATTYVVEAGTAPGLANIGALPLGHLDTTFSTAAPPGTYVVRVRAANAFGVGPASNEITVVVP